MPGPVLTNDDKAPAVAYAIWLHTEPAGKSAATPAPRDLTLSWLRFGFQGLVIESDSIETILNRALDEGNDACFIQTPGNVISEDWALPHWGQIDFHACLAQNAERSDFLVCADFVKTDDFYALDTRCFLVNLHRYRDLGRPEFGTPTRRTRRLVNPRFAGGSNKRHPGAGRLEAGDGLLSAAPSSYGWNFIDVSLRQGLAVPRLPENIADKCISLAHAPVNDEQWADDEHPPRRRFLGGVKTQISRGRTGVFLWNIESYDDIPAVKSEAGGPAGHGRIRNLYCVAAGFKPNMLLYRHGFDPNAEVTFFDYSRRALEVRQTLLNEWDGRDYPDFCRLLMQRFPPEGTFYQLWNGLQPSQIDWTDVDRLWESELARWGGADNFQKQWAAQRKLNYRFIHCDIVDEPAPLLEHVHGSAGTVVWWSNAFFTVSGNWLLSIEQRRNRFRRWIERLAEHAPQSVLYGADHNNTPVNNINAADYAAVLGGRCETAECNELIPRRDSAVPLRF